MERERLINRRRQGDLGEASAIEWLTRQGATVFIPFGHSPDYDLVADFGDGALRIQVKTSTQHVTTPNGHERCSVMIATNGGNQSWTGITKRFDPSRFDFLFVLTGDGRRWLIPAERIKARNCLQLGGPKYGEFEIEATLPIADLVYEAAGAPLDSGDPGEYPRGQRTAAVNRQAQPSQVRLLPPPSIIPARLVPSKYERRRGKHGEAVINQKRRVTLPQQALIDAGLRDGDRVRAHANGPGRIILEKTGLPIWAEGDSVPERKAPPEGGA